MANTLPEPLPVRVRLIQWLSNSSQIIMQQPPMYHDFDFSLPHNRASLTAIINDCNGSICNGILHPDEGVDRIVVACSGLENGVVPAGTIV